MLLERTWTTAAAAATGTRARARGRRAALQNFPLVLADKRLLELLQLALARHLEGFAFLHRQQLRRLIHVLLLLVAQFFRYHVRLHFSYVPPLVSMALRAAAQAQRPPMFRQGEMNESDGKGNAEPD